LALRSQRLIAAANIPRRYKHCEVSNFEVLSGPYEPVMARARLIAGKFIEEYPLEGNQGLLFLGPVGVGKTHLAVGVAKELMRSRGVPVLFWDYRELLKEIQNSYNPSVDVSEMDLLRPIFEIELLVLDELGAIRSTDWVWNTVSLILNSRYNNQLTTLITSNLPDQPPRDLPAAAASRSAEAANYAAGHPTLGDRITEPMRSRLHEMCRVVELNGVDWRQQVKKASFSPL
jgi:DNA replication protein DnaC